MEDGLPKRSDYRRFKIRHQPGQDDFAAMEEVLTRRFRRYLRGARRGRARRASGSRTRPTSLLVDGGKGQLGVAVRVLEELGLEDIAVASLAKRFEEVYLPGRAGAGAHPARLRGALPAPAGARRGAPLRDHVPPPAARQEDDALGARRRARARARPAGRRLLKEFGSVKRLRELTEEELVAIPWLPDTGRPRAVRAAARRPHAPSEHRRRAR